MMNILRNEEMEKVLEAKNEGQRGFIHFFSKWGFDVISNGTTTLDHLHTPSRLYWNNAVH